MPRDDDWNQCSVVERVPKSTAQNDALVATGQLGKLFVVILGVVFTDGEDAERDHRLAKRSPTESGRGQNNKGRARPALPDSQQLALTAPAAAKGKGKGNGKRRNRGGQKKRQGCNLVVRAGF